MKRIFTLAVIFLLVHTIAVAQIGINTDASTPDTSSMMDIKSSTKGILVPRMTTAQRAAIKSPAKGLLVYDSTTTSFWYHNGVAWNELTAGASGWNLTGNSNLTPGNNFIGTRDNEALVFKVNNTLAGSLDTLANASYGIGALAAHTTGTALVAIGDSALFSNTSGYGNTAIGSKAMYTNGTGANTALDEGSRNTAVGTQAMYSNTKGLYNAAVGFQALYANTTGYFNAALGYNALGANIGGTNNTAIGLAAMAYNTSGGFNTALGTRALQNNTAGHSNIAIGSWALYNNTSGSNLIAIGDSALFNQLPNRFGYIGNIAIGTQALYGNTSGTNNTATGYHSLTANNSGFDNTAFGASTLASNTTGNHNTAFGGVALSTGATGSYLTALGYGVAATTDNLTNATAIGAYATVNQSNSMILGSIAGQNGASSSVNVGIGTTAPLAPLHIHSNNADNFQNAKTLLLDDLNSVPTIRFQGSGAYASKWWNITLEPYTPSSGDNAGIPLTSLVLSDQSMYPNVRFEQGLTYFLGDINVTGDATVQGNMYLSGSIHYSDVRLKEDIEPLPAVLPNLMKLNGYTYHWKNKKDTTLQIGVIAQEVQKIYPELVHADPKGILGVNYVQLVPVLITAIKEQQGEIDELKAEMKKLAEMVKAK